jgi:predicted MPP superfamily phosphohydrolase
MKLPRLRRLTRRGFLRLGFYGTAGAVLGYTYFIEPHWVEIVRRDLPVMNLPPQWSGRTLVQISDLHIGPIVDDAYIRSALRLAASLKPDLLAITGDFVSYHGPEQIDQAARVLAQVAPARLGTLAILGNHDYGHGWSELDVADRLEKQLRNVGIDVLRNQARDMDGLVIVGLDDLWGRQFDPDRVLPGLDPNKAAIVLSHNPDAVDRPGWGNYRGWILSGHTHGGQCKPPFLPPPLLPVENKRYTAGEFDLYDGRRLYINRGLGYLRRVRFNVRPEITAFTLVSV